MGRDTKASDWEFTGLFSASLSAGVTGGRWFFSFRSRSLDIMEDFTLLAFGVNASLPGASIDISLPDFDSADLCWSKIACKRPFAISELDGAEGSFWNYGVSGAFTGYSDMYLTAAIPATLNNYRTGNFNAEWLFENQRNNGYSLGLEAMPGASAMYVVGRFSSLGSIIGKYLFKPVAKATIKVIQYTAPIAETQRNLICMVGGLYMAGEALQSGRHIMLLRAFSEGYTEALTDLSKARGWTMSDAAYDRLAGLDFQSLYDKADVAYRERGSTGASDALDLARVAGRSKIVKHYDSFFRTYGQGEVETRMARLRSIFGEDDGRRRKALEEKFERMTQQGKPAGIELGSL